MTPSAAPAHPGNESVMPDFCNIGVIFRSLLAVNAVVLLSALLHAADWRAGMRAYLDSSVMVELATLTSLFALCSLRNIAALLSPWLQRGLCMLVPVLITVPVAYLLSLIVPAPGSQPLREVIRAAFAAAFFGGWLQHYFELRMRAYSPALVEARLQALQARIRPHFLFNSLNAVLSLIRTQPRQAENTLENLADLFRILLRDAKHMTSLAQELQFCRQYLAIEQVRLGERLTVQWETAGIAKEILEKASVPSLLLQPLLENAVHHGIEPASQPGVIRIALNRLLDRIEIVITNPLHGAVATPGNQMALDNIRERLVLLYDVEAQLSTMAIDGQFEVRLRLPYSKVA